MDSGDHRFPTQHLTKRLANSGYRATAHREHVYDVLIQDADHPTAEELFMRAKRRMPDISMATVYNCLDALVKCHLVRQVHIDRGATRFCPNMEKHCHFFCDQCGGVFDIEMSTTGPNSQAQLPEGFTANHCEVAFRGVCRHCSTQKTR